MSNGDEVSESLRNQAVRLVERAAEEGRIIPADRDLRLGQIRSATTRWDVEVALGDLRHELPFSDGPASVRPSAGSSEISHPDSAPRRSWPVGALLGGVASVVAGIAAVVLVVNLLVGTDDDSASGIPVTPNVPVPSAETPVEPPDDSGATGKPESGGVLTAQGFRSLLAAVREETGRTEVFDATLYPDYAVLQLPVDAKSQRQAYYSWDGSTLEGRDLFGRATGPRVDLAEVRVAAMLQLLRQARRQVEEPNSWYVIVRGPGQFDEAAMYAYATNKFTEGGYVSATLAGRVIRRVTW